MQFKIHLLTNPKFLGDKNQALGIKAKLAKQYGSAIAQIKEWDDSKDEELANLNNELKSNTQSQHILISIGDHGLLALKKIERTPKSKALSVYASHQVFPELKNTTDKIDIVALPAHVIEHQIRQELSTPNLRLIQTIGVAHNITDEELDKAYSDWQQDSQKPIQSNDFYIGVILGGDAPEPNGTMRYFTAIEAKALASFLAQLGKQNINATFLITNSPRTGKFNSETKQEQKVHTGETLDETSKALLQELDSHHVKYQFFDFVAGKPSAYKPILRALQKQNSIAVVTGDSTSMVTEMADSLVDKPLYVINVGSMNASHEAHVRSVNRAGYAHLVSLGGDQQHKCIPAAEVNLAHNRETAAESIAKEVSNHLTQNAGNSLHQTNQAKTFKLGMKYVSTAGLLFTHHKTSEMKNISITKDTKVHVHL